MHGHASILPARAWAGRPAAAAQNGAVRTRRLLAAAVALAAVLATSACTAPPRPVGSPQPSVTSTASPSPSGRPLVVATLGDSLTRGFDACSHYGDCPSVSWAGGSDPRVDSLASRLEARTERPVQVHDLARSGAPVADLDRQVQSAVAVRPDLVTVLIGANDVCQGLVESMTPVADYAAAVERAVAAITERTPAVVLLASAPDPTVLLEAGAGDPTARFLWSHGGICPAALAAPRSEAPEAVDRRAAVSVRIAAYDAALATVCARFPRCITDGGALRAYRPSLQQLSALDAFHPSVSGQHELARLEWAALSASAGAEELLRASG
jgi:lysophospholipase L1-like esterase